VALSCGKVSRRFNARTAAKLSIFFADYSAGRFKPRRDYHVICVHPHPVSPFGHGQNARTTGGAGILPAASPQRGTAVFLSVGDA
jgi:hypothetical protein